MSKIQLPATRPIRPAWNKGRLIGQKRPIVPKQVWAIRARLELADNLRDPALFNLAIDSKLRGCDLVRLRVSDLVVGGSFSFGGILRTCVRLFIFALHARSMPRSVIAQHFDD